MRQTLTVRSSRSRAFDARGSDAERRQSEQDDHERQLEDNYSGKGKRGEKPRPAPAAMGGQQPDPGRNQQPGRSRRKSTQGMLKNSEVSILKVQTTQRQPNRQRY